MIFRWKRPKTVCQNPAFDDLAAPQWKIALNFPFALPILLRTELINWPSGIERLSPVDHPTWWRYPNPSSQARSQCE